MATGGTLRPRPPLSPSPSPLPLFPPLYASPPLAHPLAGPNSVAQCCGGQGVRRSGGGTYGGHHQLYSIPPNKNAPARERAGQAVQQHVGDVEQERVQPARPHARPQALVCAHGARLDERAPLCGPVYGWGYRAHGGVVCVWVGGRCVPGSMSARSVNLRALDEFICSPPPATRHPPPAWQHTRPAPCTTHPAPAASGASAARPTAAASGGRTAPSGGGTTCGSGQR
jgi:hypothetical protein